MKKKILVILGSVRPVRAGSKVADWVMNKTTDRSNGIEYQLVDLKEINLPFSDEPESPRTAEKYQHQHTRDWSAIIDAADGFIFVTPEYNHGYPPALKNAVDYLYREWKGKPACFVGYGGSGAKDSIRQFKEVLTRLGLVFMKNQLGISRIWEAFDESGDIKTGLLDGDITKLFDEMEKAVNG